MVSLTDKQRVVHEMYQAFFAGDVDAALARCSDDAQWHAVTPAPVDGSHPMREYFTEILPSAIRSMSATAEYRVEPARYSEVGDLVVSHLRTSHGAGVMVFRVHGDLVTDAWAINADGRAADGWY